MRPPGPPPLLGVVLLTGARRSYAAPLPDRGVGDSARAFAWEPGRDDAASATSGRRQGDESTGSWSGPAGGRAAGRPDASASAGHPSSRSASRTPTRHMSAGQASGRDGAPTHAPSERAGPSRSPAHLDGPPATGSPGHGGNAPESSGRPRAADADGRADAAPSGRAGSDEDRVEPASRTPGTPHGSPSPPAANAAGSPRSPGSDTPPLSFRMIAPGVWTDPTARPQASERAPGHVADAASALAPRRADDRARHPTASSSRPRGSGHTGVPAREQEPEVASSGTPAPTDAGDPSLVWGAPGTPVPTSHGSATEGRRERSASAAPGPYRIPEARRVVELAARVEDAAESARRVAAATESPGLRRVAGSGTGSVRGGPTPSPSIRPSGVVHVRDDGSVRALMDRIRRLEREDRFRRGGL